MTEPVYTHEQRNAVISALLEHLDVAYPGMHLRANTPDWYVAAAAVACDITPQKHQTTDDMVDYVKYDMFGDTPKMAAITNSLAEQIREEVDKEILNNIKIEFTLEENDI